MKNSSVNKVNMNKVIQPSIKYTAMVNIVVQRQFEDTTSRAFLGGGTGTVFKLFSIGSIN